MPRSFYLSLFAVFTFLAVLFVCVVAYLTTEAFQGVELEQVEGHAQTLVLAAVSCVICTFVAWGLYEQARKAR